MNKATLNQARELLVLSRAGDEAAMLALCVEIEASVGDGPSGTDHAMQFLHALRGGSVPRTVEVEARLDELDVLVAGRPAGERAAYLDREARASAYVRPTLPPPPPAPVLTEREKFRAREAARIEAERAAAELDMRRRHAEEAERSALARADDDAPYVLADAAEVWGAYADQLVGVEADAARTKALELVEAAKILAPVAAEAELDELATRLGGPK
jgi:hypothetical protein